jgi:hypothetical protein
MGRLPKTKLVKRLNILESNRLREAPSNRRLATPSRLHSIAKKSSALKKSNPKIAESYTKAKRSLSKVPITHYFNQKFS